MAELRWHPLIKDWVMIASHRQNRPQMPKDWCPFCPPKPGEKKNVPEHYDVYKYDNDFPALSQNPPVPDDVETELYKVRPSYGKCEVILFSPDHNSTLCELSLEHIGKLIDLWKERFTELSKDEKIKYIFIFENKGEAVGVTMPHPHGQIYGYSVVPKKIQLELESCKEHYEEKGKCLICDMNDNEKEFGKRVVYENKNFLAYIPFFCEYPYGVYIVAKNHKQYITDFNAEESADLADMLKNVTGAYDALFDMRFPYMMCMHNGPVNIGEDTSDYYHFHIEFYPPLRAADKIKFNASSETGVWAHCNPTAPEAKAEELRAAFKKFAEKNAKK